MSPHDRSHGFHRRLGFGDRPAVLVVDVCRAYFEAGSPLFLDRPTVLDAVGDLVDTARAHGVPVWWTRMEVPTDGPPSVFRRKVEALSVFEAGHPLGDWVPGLHPASDEPVVGKEQASAYFGTDLADRLRADGIDTVVVCGVSTSGCVRASALDACQHDFVPVVVDEACGDRTDEVHRRTLDDLDAKYADVVPLVDALATLRGEGGSGNAV